MRSLLILLILNFSFPCSIGVAYDYQGFPVIWKNRDKPVDSTNRLNRLYLVNNNFDHDILSITSANSSKRYMGLNDKGFGIVNSYIDDQNDSVLTINDELVTDALLHCETIEDFINRLQNYMNNPNLLIDSDSGDKILSNFAVLDGTGAAGMFEVYADENNVMFEYELLALGSIDYIVRTNHFNFLVNYNPINISASETRLNKAIQMIDSIVYDGSGNVVFEFSDLFDLSSFIAGNPSSNVGPFLRNFSKSNQENYHIPYPYQNSQNYGYGYFYTGHSINRSKTVSSVVIKGGVSENLENEESSEPIMWSNFGNPTTSPYLPLKISNFIDYSDSDEGEDIPDSIPLELNDNGDSSLSLLTQEIKDFLFNYSPQGNSFNRYVDSYLIESSFNVIDSIEQGLIQNHSNPGFSIDWEVSQAYGLLNNYRNDLIGGVYHDFSCRTGLQYFNSLNSTIVVDQSKHNPNNCYWDIDYLDSGSTSSSSDCFNPSINYPILENLIINHSAVYGVDQSSCDPFYFFIGDLNFDSQVNIADIVIAINIVLGLQPEDMVANINGDSYVDILDIMIIINIILND